MGPNVGTDRASVSVSSVFVGRARELDVLRAGLAEAAAGHGRIIMLVGEPGIGKTRTAGEFAVEARAGGAQILRGACYEGEWAPPYGPFVEALTAYARTADAAKMRHDLGFGAGPLARIIPAVRERLADISEPMVLKPDEERFRLFDAVAQLLIAISVRTPLVLVLDDLHWADQGTIALLRHVARFAPHHRLMLLGAYRDVDLDPAHGLNDLLGVLRRESNYGRLLLKGLAADEAAALVAQLATQQVSDGIVASINRHTEGNPFFIREVLQHLIEEGALAADRPFDLPAMSVPDGVRDVIGRRLARVSAETTRLLTVAAAFNGPFRLAVGAAVVGLEEQAALQAIDAALAAQLIRPTIHADVYDFGHALVRHTLYAALSPSRRARLHRQIAEAMDRLYAAQSTERAGEIVYQYERSRDLPGVNHGAKYALIAAEQAEATYAYQQVATYLRLALDFLPPADERRPRVWARMGFALTWASDFDAAAEAAKSAAEMIAVTEGAQAAAGYLADIARALSDSGGYDAACVVARQGLAHAGGRRDVIWAQLKAVDVLQREVADPSYPGIAIDSPDRQAIAAVLAAELAERPSEQWVDRAAGALGTGFYLSAFPTRRELLAREFALVTYAAGLYRDALPIYQEIAERAEQNGRITLAVSAWSTLFRFHVSLGGFASAREARTRAVALVNRLTVSSTGTAALVAGEDEWRMARDEGWGERIDGLGPGFGERFVLAIYRASMHAAAARIHARRGRADRAMEALAEAVPAIERAPVWSENYVRIVCDAVEALWLTNRLDHASVMGRSLREKIIPSDFRYPMVDGHQALGRICALQERYDEAIDGFRRARTVLDEQGARPLRAIVDYDEAVMYVRRSDDGDRDRAQPLLAAALAQFRALDMPGWIRRAEHLQRHGTEWHADLSSPRADPRAAPLSSEADSRVREPKTGGPEALPHVFRRAGDMWTISFEGTTVQLRDARGLRYLARLLAHPAREQHATELIGVPLNASGSPRSASDAQVVGADLGDAGVVLDAEATAQYQRRLTELREELADADADNDLGRSARLREELAFLAEQLASAGRGRRTASHAERARVSVTKGIVSAVKRIAAAHPECGRHLKATIRTGYFCSYSPDPRLRIEWLT